MKWYWSGGAGEEVGKYKYLHFQPTVNKAFDYIRTNQERSETMKMKGNNQE